METVALLFQSFTGGVGFHHFGESIGQLGSGVYPVQSNPSARISLIQQLGSKFLTVGNSSWSGQVIKTLRSVIARSWSFAF